MPKLSRFGVWVLVDGDELPEYGTSISNDQKTVTTYVEAQDGKRYTLRTKGPRNKTGWRRNTCKVQAGLTA